MPRCGSRPQAVDGRPVMLLPNPFYHSYLGAAYAPTANLTS